MLHHLHCIKKRLWLGIVLLGLASLNAEAQVDVNIQSPSPLALKVQDLFHVQVTNSLAQEPTVYIEGNIEKGGSGKVLTAKSESFQLKTGTRLFQYPQIQINQLNFFDAKVKEVVQATNNLPSGQYILCVKLRNSQTNQVLGQHCLEHSPSNQTPPQLAYPPDQSEVPVPFPNFTWIPPAPQPAGGSYTYKMEIAQMNGNQTPEDAMLNNPVFFSKQGIPQTNLQYPPHAPDLQKDQTYAWQVTAYAGNYEVGKTEVWAFEFPKKDSLTQKEKPKPEGNYLELKPKVKGNYHMVERYLRFAFRESHNSKILDFELLNDQDEVITPEGLDLVNRYGQNHYELDLQEHKVFEDDAFYTLKVKDLTGKPFYIKFQYRKK